MSVLSKGRIKERLALTVEDRASLVITPLLDEGEAFG
jgi:hypothetical protein